MKYPDFIEQLIIDKEYSQLTPAQKEQVGEWVQNEAEYTVIRQLLINVDAIAEGEQQLTPPTKIKTDLQQAFNKKHANNKPKYSPNWAVGLRVAASVLVLAIAIFVYRQDKPEDISKAKQPNIDGAEIKQHPEVVAKTEPTATAGGKIEVAPTNVPDEPKEPKPTEINNINSVTAATYADLNELVVTVF
jgi:hypothetical protein